MIRGILTTCNSLFEPRQTLEDRDVFVEYQIHDFPKRTVALLILFVMADGLRIDFQSQGHQKPSVDL